VRSIFILVAALLALGAIPASADWPTYHADAQRTGVDQSSAGTPLPFASTWTSPNLGGKIYAEPLVYHGLVIVATEGNDVYALSETTGQVVWHANAGTPVPSTALPCGDITPTVGITSTPVIDPATGTLYLVADLWDGTHAHHMLVAYSAVTGAQQWTKGVDQPGSTPENQLQRAGLNLSAGRVLIGFGGNDGDCGTYWGWLVSVAGDGSSMTAWQAASAGNGAAIWATAGPTVDASGRVFVATGNSDASASPYDYSDAVVRFPSPSLLSPNPGPSDYFTPSNWVTLNTDDLDLGSSGTVLLANGLAFQDGKDGNGFLLSTAGLGGIGAQLYEASTGCASFGGDAYANGVIYVACASGGTLALSVNASAPSFSPLWRGPSDANGSPILAGGLVWVTSYTNGVLYGLNPQTGAVVVRQSTPAMEHFTSPSASDGQLVLATGSTVEAYRIAAAVAVGPTLAVKRAGSGSGTVQGPAIACPGTCSASYPAGTKVTLTATPGAGSGFGGWSGGGCAGIATACTVTVSANTTVTATFKRIGRPRVSGSLSGVGKHRPRLRLTARAGGGAPALSGLAVALPAGLRFERRGLARGVSVTARPGRHLRFIARLRQGLLVIALHTPQRSVTVLLHGHALAATKRLARAVVHARRRPRLKIIVTVLDAGGKSSQVILKLRA
jgi:outer membrane protein assembly factor BamB